MNRSGSAARIKDTWSMKHALRTILAATAVVSATASTFANDAITQDERMGWWREARFGMFIHWGIYSVLGGEWEGKDYGKEMGGPSAEWIMLKAPVPKEEYKKLAQQFNPVKFDAKAWVTLAKNAGMKYLVITAKHHDGFCMFDTAHTDYDIMDATPFKRDIIKELADACRQQDIRFGVYYSQTQDWYHHYLGRERNKKPTPGYVAMCKRQVRELLTNYGDISIMWFDTGSSRLALNHSYGKLVRDLQPRAVISSRLYSSNVKEKDRRYADFEALPDRAIPDRRIQGDAETCMTMRHNWGYDRDDDHWKSTKDIIERLVLSACRGANFLLNVGPTPEGTLVPEEIERLQAIGKWMQVNGESVYGTTASPLDFDFAWGAMSRKPGRLYLHVFKWDPAGIVFNGVVSKPDRAYLLADPKRKSLAIRQDVNRHITTIEVPAEAPDPSDSVIVLEFKGPLEIDADATGTYHWSKSTGVEHGWPKE
jgi:alpha-L-fucosidase